jgi:glycosyltransferase involved in cell wall biosynthesis
LRRIVRSVKPTLIQGWMYHGNLAASAAARMAPGSPTVFWNVRHSLYDLKAEKSLTRQVIRGNRFFSREPGAIIYNSRLSRTQHEAFGFSESRAKVIPNGFDLERLRPEPETGAVVRQEIGFPADATVVGHVARFHPMKDHASFLRAAVKVARANPSARFLLVGRDVSPTNPPLAGIVPPDLSGQFVFTGERSDPHRLMQAMDVLAVSSAWGEAFPNVLGEAMACGVPCVTTDVGDSADIVGNTGIVVPPSNSQALSDGLRAMLAKSAVERTALGRSARRKIAERYALGRVVDQYTELYRKVTA